MPAAHDLSSRIEAAFTAGPAAVGDPAALEAFSELRAALEAGDLRAAEPDTASPTGLAGKCLGEARHPARLSAGRLEATDSAAGLSFVDKHTYPARQFTAEQGVRVVPGGSSVRAGRTWRRAWCACRRCM